MTQANSAQGNWTYTYNHADQIRTAARSGAGATNATYVYDGNGLRVEKKVSSASGLDVTRYLWAGAEVVKEYTGAGAAKATYLLGAGREGLKTAAGWQFYCRDALSSTVMTTDASGEIASQFEYGDWGETTQVFGSAALYNPYRYTGQQFDGETGLYSLRARSYAPGLGRFTSRDPIAYAGGLNLYSYCSGDPINFVDPNGLEPKVTIGVGSPYTRDGLEHGVLTPVSHDPNVQVQDGISSTQFIQALETSDYFIYTGHHFRSDGTILLSDGYFKPTDLFMGAKKLPKAVFLDACHSRQSLPKTGDYPGTSFVGLDDFINKYPAASESLRAAQQFLHPSNTLPNFVGPVDATTNVVSDPGRGVPGLTVVR